VFRKAISRVAMTPPCRLLAILRSSSLDCSDPDFDADCRRAITKKNGSPTVHLARGYHPEPSRRLQAETSDRGGSVGGCSPRSHGWTQGVCEGHEEFVRPSHDVVLGRNGGSYCVRPIWATGLIRHLWTMGCIRPTRVGGRHHQRSQP
jgi:hypothetical protein